MSSVSKKKCPVVLRFEGMSPKALARYEAHRTRRGGDLGHIDTSRSHLNTRLIGDEDWAAKALSEIQEMRLGNFADEIEALARRNRRKDLRRRVFEGPKDPYRASRHGPMREVILTANKEWFDDDISVFLGEAGQNPREVAFEERAVAWLKHHFKADVIHARADRDESAYHIHAVIMPRVTDVMMRTCKKTGEKKEIARRRKLQPSKFPMIRNYEKAQDSVGEWFSEIGLCRGQRHKQAVRDALNSGKEPPMTPRHVRPATWRASEEARLAAREAKLIERERAVAAREEEAEGVMDYVEAVSSGKIDAVGRPTDDGAASTPTEKRPSQGGSIGFLKARKAFRSVWKRLKGRALTNAEATVRAEFEGAFSEIKHAHEELAKIKKLLPPSVAKAVAQVSGPT